MEEVEAELELPGLTIEAQMEASRPKVSFGQDDNQLLDIDVNATEDQAQE